jgi:hypothetical protein
MHALSNFYGVNVNQNFVVMSKVAALQKCPHRRRKDDQLRDKMSQGHNILNTFCHIGRQKF